GWLTRLLPQQPASRHAVHHACTSRLELQILEGRLAPATLTVNSAADNSAPGDFLTLREALLLVDYGGDARAALGRDLTACPAAQVDAGTPFGAADTIRFDPALPGHHTL